jgi:hypothetical protein
VTEREELHPSENIHLKGPRKRARRRGRQALFSGWRPEKTVVELQPVTETLLSRRARRERPLQRTLKRTESCADKLTLYNSRIDDI